MTLRAADFSAPDNISVSSFKISPFPICYSTGFFFCPNFNLDWTEWFTCLSQLGPRYNQNSENERNGQVWKTLACAVVVTVMLEWKYSWDWSNFAAFVRSNPIISLANRLYDWWWRVCWSSVTAYLAEHWSQASKKKKIDWVDRVMYYRVS